MTLLQSIVQELDQELQRLHTLRSLVAGLSRTNALVRRYTETASAPPSESGTSIAAMASATPETIHATKRTRRPRRDAGTRRGPRGPKAVTEPTALSRSVPAGPVVFYPGRVSPAVETAIEAESTLPLAAESLDLDAQSRQLAARWRATPTT